MTMRIVIIFIAICLVGIVLSEITVRKIERNGMTETLTADKFLEVTRNSKSISIGENLGNGGIFIVVKYHSDEHEDDLIKTFEGPNPSSIEYHVYMGLLGEIYSVPGLSGFVDGYLKKHLRRLGRMTK